MAETSSLWKRWKPRLAIAEQTFAAGNLPSKSATKGGGRNYVLIANKIPCNSAYGFGGHPGI